jgi:hypothetical protein
VFTPLVVINEGTPASWLGVTEVNTGAAANAGVAKGRVIVMTRAIAANIDNSLLLMGCLLNDTGYTILFF